MARAADPLIAPGRLNHRSRQRHLRFEQEWVFVAPHAQHRDADAIPRWQSRERRLIGVWACERSAIPIQRRRERLRPCQVAQMALVIALAAAPFTKEPPVIGGQRRLGDACLEEEIEVPGFLALRDRIPAGVAGRAD